MGDGPGGRPEVALPDTGNDGTGARKGRLDERIVEFVPDFQCGFGSGGGKIEVAGLNVVMTGAAGDPKVERELQAYPCVRLAVMLELLPCGTLIGGGAPQQLHVSLFRITAFGAGLVVDDAALTAS